MVNEFCPKNYSLSGNNALYCSVCFEDIQAKLGEEYLSRPELIHTICDRTPDNFKQCPILLRSQESPLAQCIKLKEPILEVPKINPLIIRK